MTLLQGILKGFHDEPGCVWYVYFFVPFAPA